MEDPTIKEKETFRQYAFVGELMIRLAPWLVKRCWPSAKFLAAIYLATLFLQMGLAATKASTIDEQTLEISKQLKCPVCQNVPVAYSQSQLAGEMRQVIREKVAQGESKDAVIQYFVDRYGEEVLLEPRLEGFGLLLWITSIGIVAIGTFIVTIVLWNWSQTRHMSTPVVSTLTDTGKPSSVELEHRFEKEFARYKQGKRK